MVGPLDHSSDLLEASKKVADSTLNRDQRSKILLVKSSPLGQRKETFAPAS